MLFNYLVHVKISSPGGVMYMLSGFCCVLHKINFFFFPLCLKRFVVILLLAFCKTDLVVLT